MDTKVTNGEGDGKRTRADLTETSGGEDEPTPPRRGVTKPPRKRHHNPSAPMEFEASSSTSGMAESFYDNSSSSQEDGDSEGQVGSDDESVSINGMCLSELDLVTEGNEAAKQEAGLDTALNQVTTTKILDGAPNKLPELVGWLEEHTEGVKLKGWEQADGGKIKVTFAGTKCVFGNEHDDHQPCCVSLTNKNSQIRATVGCSADACKKNSIKLLWDGKKSCWAKKPRSRRTRTALDSLLDHEEGGVAGASGSGSADDESDLPLLSSARRQFDRRYFVTPQGSGTYVVQPDCFNPEQEVMYTRIMTVAEFLAYTARQWAIARQSGSEEEEDEGSTQRRVSVGPVWLRHPKTRQVAGLIMDPAIAPGFGRKAIAVPTAEARAKYPNGVTVYNMWRGLAVQPTEGDWSLIDQHIREGVANGKLAVYDYLLNWVAHLVQRPDKKLKVAIVLQGDQGKGKGAFIKDTVGALFGSHHFVQIVRAEQVTGRFNAVLKDKLVVFLDEAFFAGDKSQTGVLKALVTEETLPLEPKGKDPFTVKNRIALLMASNNEWVAPIEVTNRRFFMVQVNNDATFLTPDYFDALYKQIEGDGLAAFLHAMLARDITDFDPRAFPRTDTEAFEWDNLLRTASPEMRFMYEYLKEADATELTWAGEHCVQKGQLYSQFLDKTNASRQYHPESAVHKKFLQYVTMETVKETIDIYEQSGRKTTRRVNSFRFPPLAECRHQFEKAVNKSAKTLWDD